MAEKNSNTRGRGDGKAESLHQDEKEVSEEEEETIENMAKAVKVSVRVRDCKALVKESTGTRKVVAGVPRKLVGISRLNSNSTKTPRKIKLSKTEMRHRSENLAPKPRPQKKSTGGHRLLQ